MRIGILTFHYAHNYGAVLQAFALKTYLTRQGHDVKIINYRNKTIASKYSERMKSGIPLKHLYRLNLLKRELNFLLNRPYAMKDWILQCRNFKQFIERYLLDTEVIFNTSGFNEQYDILITGSDQVWTSQLTGGLDKFYLLDFEFRGYKVSYGASIACGYIPIKEVDTFRKCLKNFKYISTREKTLSDSIQEKLLLNSEIVLDPTLLLNKEEYITLAQECKLPPQRKPYIFVYFVQEDTNMHNMALEYATKLGCCVIELHYYIKKGFDTSYQHAYYGPNEFLNGMLNADFILTNSFHGTIFSIIFEKQFFSVYEQNPRIQNLLDSLNISERHISEYKPLDYVSDIDYNTLYYKLESMRKKSVDFLAKCCS